MNRSSNVILSILLLVLTMGQVLGQWDHMLHKTYPQRYREIGQIYLRVVCEEDSTTVFSEISGMRSYAVTHHDSELELESDLLKAYYLTLKHKSQSPRIVSMLNDIAARGEKQNNGQISARAYKVLADHYWDEARNYELAFETFILQENYLNSLSTDELPDKAYALASIATAYLQFSEYEKALNLFRQILTLKYNPDAYAGHNGALYSIADIHRQQGNLDSSDHYLQRIIRKESAGNYEVWEAIARGGLGQNAYLRGKYGEATPLLQYNIDHAVSHNDFGRAAELLIIRADIAFKDNEFDRAGNLAETARKYMSSSPPDRYKHFPELYSILVKVAAKQGKAQLAEVYLDSALVAKDSLTHKYNAKLMLRAHQKNELQKLRAKMESSESDQTQKLIQRNLALALLLLGAAGAVYVYKSQRKQHQQVQQLKELEIRQKEQELENATLQLNEFARNISDKSRQIEVLENKQNPDAVALSQLRENTILTQDEWDYFKKLFGKVHGDYLHRLHNKYPELTQSEIRFIALTKLGLGYQEMSMTLGVSSHAVRTTKYRLLKKIDIPDDRTLEKLVMDI